MRKDSYEVSVLVKSKPIREYNHEGCMYIEGRQGSKYELKFKNNSSSKVVVIPSVDGLSTINGVPVTETTPGFIVDPFQSIIIPGWTVDENTVAAFEFQDRKKSYNEMSGQGGENVGVIGFLVYKEKIKTYDNIRYTKSTFVPDPFDIWRYGSAPLTGSPLRGIGDTITCSASANGTFYDANPKGFDMGTGFGEASEYKTTKVDFERCDNPDSQLVIYYDSKKNLQRMGIEIVPDKWSPEHKPNPFPSMNFGCKPPSGWTK